MKEPNVEIHTHFSDDMPGIKMLLAFQKKKLIYSAVYDIKTKVLLLVENKKSKVTREIITCMMQDNLIEGWFQEEYNPQGVQH